MTELSWPTEPSVTSISFRMPSTPATPTTPQLGILGVGYAIVTAIVIGSLVYVSVKSFLTTGEKCDAILQKQDVINTKLDKVLSKMPLD